MSAGAVVECGAPVRLGRVLRGVLIVVAAAYLAALLLLVAFQRHLVFMNDPAHVAPAAVGLPEVTEHVIATTDGERLIGWWVPPRSGQRIVLDFQGQGGGPSWRAGRIRHFIGAGYGILTVAYRGFAGSTGTPSEDGLYEDARSAYGWLVAKGYSANDIVVFGESLGSGVAVKLASEAPVAAVILDSPFTSLIDVAAGRFPYFPVRLLSRFSFDSLARIPAIRAPLLVIHGDHDSIVPYELGQRLFAAAEGAKRFVSIPGGGHTMAFEKGPWAAISAFLAGLGPRS